MTMEPEVMVAIGVGSTGFILGIFNLIWGTGLLTRRQVVKLQNVRFLVNARTGNQREQEDRINEVYVSCEFELVRTSGIKDCFVRRIQLKLNPTVCKELHQYLQVPNNAIVETGMPYTVKLEINKPDPFSIQKGIAIQPLLSKIHKETWDSKDDQKSSELDILQQQLNKKIKKLSTKYKIGWTDTKEKTHWHRLPPKCWARFFPERFWWRI